MKTGTKTGLKDKNGNDICQGDTLSIVSIFGYEYKNIEVKYSKRKAAFVVSVFDEYLREFQIDFVCRCIIKGETAILN